MVKFSKSVIAVLAVSALIFGISGCKKGGTPAEDAGKEIDQTVDKAEKKMDAAVDKAGQKVKDTGQKMKDSVKK
jgi:hyperosmotically inducible protein